MVDLEAIGEIVHPCAALVGMGDYDHLMSSIDELG